MCPPFLRIKFIKKNSPHDQALRQPCKFLILAILEIRVKHPIRIKVMIKDKMGKSASPTKNFRVKGSNNEGKARNEDQTGKTKPRPDQYT